MPPSTSLKSTVSDPGALVPETNSAGVAELLAAGKALGSPIRVDGHRPSILVPQGFKLEALPFAVRAPLPDHVRQSVTFDDADSFIAYVRRWKRAESVLFAQLPRDGKSPQFRAVFDYHTCDAGQDDASLHAPARCAHVALYPCPLSEEWKTWDAIDGEPQLQMAFIDFIEANGVDIIQPASANLMELAMNFESKTEVLFQTRVDRVTGGRQLSYKETVDAGNAGTVKVPDALAIFVPVFEGGKKYEVGARLEWLPQGGKLKVVVHLRRPLDVIREALTDIRQTIEAGTEMSVLNGTAGQVAE